MAAPRFITTCLLLSTAASLSSCRIINGQVDYSWVGEQFTPPVDDSVIIDRGTGALDIPASAPITTPGQPTVTPAPLPPPPQQKKQGVFARLFGQNRPDTTAAAAPTGYTTYTVVAGDTLSGIARRYGTRTHTLIRINSLDTTRPLQINQKLRIPTTAGATPKPTARRSRTEASSQQQPGFFARVFRQNATAPTTGAPSPAPKVYYTTYTVVVGDTLSGIARRHGTTARHLIDINHIDTTRPLQVNQKLKVPTTKAPASPTPAAAPTPAPRAAEPTPPVSEPIGQLPPVSATLPTSPVTSQPVPSPSPTSAPRGSYTIQAGDTLYGIARKLQLAPADLMQANGLTPETAGKLQAGATLQIPATSTTLSPQP